MKLLRIETRSGQVRCVPLAPYRDLPTWVETMRRDGWLVAPQWAMPFDMVALVDLMETVEPAAQRGEPLSITPAPGPGDGIAAAIARGHWPYRIVE
jgi:hypothetical protein